MIDSREDIEGMFKLMWGTAVRIGDQETWGHFVVEPQVELGPGEVLDDVPTVTVFQGIPGLQIDALVEVDGEGDFFVTHRLPASSPGETVLVLREA